MSPKSEDGLAFREAEAGRPNSAIPRARAVPRPRNCTFSETDWDILARRWFPVARAEDIRNMPLACQLLDVKLVVYRTRHGISVAHDLCPHRGVPLSMGWVEEDEIICPYHGLHFARDGRCTLIPAQPNVTPSERFRATMLPAVERHGLVWTCVLPTGQEPDIPPFPEWDDGAFQRILAEPTPLAAAAGRQIEGFVDVAHFAWIHHGSFADRSRSFVPIYRTRRTDYGVQSEYISDISNFPKELRHLEPEGFRWRRLFDIHPPFAAMLTIDFPEGGVLKILNVASPVSARKTLLFMPVARNFTHAGTPEEINAFNAKIIAEDQRIMEAQSPEDLPLDFDDEAHFAADRTSIAYRQALREMGLTGGEARRNSARQAND